MANDSKPTNQPDAPNEQKPASAPRHRVFHGICEEFVRRVLALSDTYSVLSQALSKILDEAADRHNEFYEKNAHVTEVDGKRKAMMPIEQAPHWNRLLMRLVRSASATMMFPGSQLTALISHYDAFLGALLKSIYSTKPELLKTIKREMQLCDLIDHTSIEAARDSLVEKEIETVLRKSHLEQLKWMEGAFSVTLTGDAALNRAFVELTERRNLYVHNDGKVSSLYLANCKAAGVELPESLKPGERLKITTEYFRSSCDRIIELIIKLSQVFWCKLCPEAQGAADGDIHNRCVELLTDGRYDVVERVLTFCLSKSRKSSDDSRIIFSINLAQAYKWLGRSDDFRKTLRNYSWNSLREKYRLAHAVLTDNYDEAAVLIKRIGKDGEVKHHDYTSWPLFREARRNEKFISALKVVFGDEFQVQQQENQSGTSAMEAAAAALKGEESAQSSTSANEDAPESG